MVFPFSIKLNFLQDVTASKFQRIQDCYVSHWGFSDATQRNHKQNPEGFRSPCVCALCNVQGFGYMVRHRACVSIINYNNIKEINI